MKEVVFAFLLYVYWRERNGLVRDWKYSFGHRIDQHVLFFYCFLYLYSIIFLLLLCNVCVPQVNLDG